MRRSCGNSLLNIDQTKALAIFLLLADAHEDGEPQPTERAAPLHPVGGIDDFHLVTLVALLKGRDKVAYLRKFKYSLNLFPLSGGYGPESFAHRNVRSHVFKTLFRKMAPTAL